MGARFNKKYNRKHHPDKAKTSEEHKMYLKMFTLINSAYDFIVSTRVEAPEQQRRDDVNENNISQYNTLQNQKLEEKFTQFSNNSSVHAGSERDYSSFSQPTFNQFTGGFSNEDFNRVFEYNKNSQPQQKSESNKILPYSQGGVVVQSSKRYTSYSDAFSCAKNPSGFVDASGIVREQLVPIDPNELQSRVNSYKSVFSHVN